jgi:hypothetical protein
LQAPPEPELLPEPDPAFTMIEDLPDFDQTAQKNTIVPLMAKDDTPAVSQTTMKPVTTEQRRSGFTGAIVYTKSDCPPCRNLVTDLQYLAANHGWTLSERELSTITPTAAIDWVIVHGQNAEAFPMVEFYRDGEFIGESRGYSLARNFADRREPLMNLIRSHPRYTAAR